MNSLAPSPSTTPRPNIAALLLVVLAAVLFAAPAAAAGPAAAAAKCRPGQLPWQVNGKSVCLKTAKLPSSPVRPTLDVRAGAWFRAATTPKSPARGAGRSFKLPTKLRRAVPRIAKFTAMAVKPTNASFRTSKSRARVATTVERGALDRRTATLPGGVEVVLTGELRRDENGNVTADVNVDAEVDGYTVRFKPEFDDTVDKLVPRVECPTADGRLSIAHSTADGGTVMVLRGRRVVASRTMRSRTTFRAEGQVGRDAKLRSVKATTTVNTAYYERGLQVESTQSGTASAERDGAIVVSGAPSVRMKIRSASLTAAQERHAERALASRLAADKDTANTIGVGADLGRWRMLADEYNWYQVPNYCAEAELTPAYAKLDEGDSLQVTGSVRSRKSNGEAAGSFGEPQVSRGGFSVVKAEADPGSPARLLATGGEPDGDGATVIASTIAASTAGRAIVEWSAEESDVNVPTSFGGWIESETVGAGARYRFQAMFDFVRTSINRGPNGFVSVWYELDHLDALDESVNSLGPTTGCRLEAKSNSGAVINSGDVELRRAGHDAPWTFALHVDFSIPDQQFAATDCPPGTVLPEFTGDIVNYLHSSPPGTAFRPIWSGSTATDMRIIDEAVTDVNGPGMLPTTAKWGLIGSY